MNNVKQEKESKNKYSFYTVEKSEIIPDSNYTENTHEEKENNISQFFYYDDGKIIQEYCFQDSYTALYRDIGNNQLAYLYEYERDDTGNEVFYIFKEDGVYIAVQTNNKLRNVFYATAEDFNLIDKKENSSSSFLSSLPIIKQINNMRLISFTIKHSTAFVQNFKFVDTEQNRAFAENFRSLSMRYTMASNLIPASTIVNETLSIANSYIATKKLDKDELLKKYIELQNFQEVCPSSIEAISPFVYNPSNTDLRSLCETLQSKLKNIENLIDMYLENELETEK